MLPWKKKKNAAQELKTYLILDLAINSLQSAAAGYHQRPNWPWNHVFEKSRYMSYFSFFIPIIPTARREGMRSTHLILNVLTPTMSASLPRPSASSHAGMSGCTTACGKMAAATQQQRECMKNYCLLLLNPMSPP